MLGMEASEGRMDRKISKLCPNEPTRRGVESPATHPLAQHIDKINTAIVLGNQKTLSQILEKNVVVEKQNVITWEIFARYVDNVFLRALSLLFFTTTVVILATAYYRKYH